MKKLLNNCLFAAFICILLFSCENMVEDKSLFICNWKIKTSDNDSTLYKQDTVYNGIFKFPPNINLSKNSIDSLLTHKKEDTNVFIVNGNSIHLYSIAKLDYLNRKIAIYKLAISKGLNFEEDNSNTFLYTQEFGVIFIRLNKGLHDYQTFELDELSIKINHSRSMLNLNSLFKEIYKDTLLFPKPLPPPQ